MTSGPIYLAPCQVQPNMGLPRGNLNNIERLPVRPPVRRASIERVCRNLFGTPERDSIAQVLEAEQQKQRVYVKERYNIDIDTLLTGQAAEREEAEEAAAAALPNLIQQELQQHELRLQKEKCNLDRVRAHETTTTTTTTTTGGAQIKRIVTPTNGERAKPYARQPSLTESFNLRKASSSSSTQKEQQQQKQRRAEVLTLPKSMRASFIGKDQHTQTDLSMKEQKKTLPLTPAASPPPSPTTTTTTAAS